MYIISGTCVCLPSYTGDDCSVNLDEPPTLYDISEESLCDLSKRPCTSISLFGNGFYGSSNIVCKLQKAEVRINFRRMKYWKLNGTRMCEYESWGTTLLSMFFIYQSSRVRQLNICLSACETGSDIMCKISEHVLNMNFKITLKHYF